MQWWMKILRPHAVLRFSEKPRSLGQIGGYIAPYAVLRLYSAKNGGVVLTNEPRITLAFLM